MEPVISVIAPVFNTEPYLAACLDSVIGQTYKNLEIILIDDASPDRCGAICEEYALRDSRFRVIHNQRNQGLAAARNIGLHAASGEFIAWVDSDDWLAPDMFAYLMDGIDRHRADIANCTIIDVFADRKAARAGAGELSYGPEQAVKLIMECRYKWELCSSLFRREVYDGVVFPPGRLHEDAFVLHRLVHQAKKIVDLPAPKYYYRHRPGSICQTENAARYCDMLAAMLDRCDFIVGHYPQYQDNIDQYKAVRFYNHLHKFFLCLRQSGEPAGNRGRLCEYMLAQARAYQDYILRYAKLGPVGRMEVRLICRNVFCAIYGAGLCAAAYEAKRKLAAHNHDQ